MTKIDLPCSVITDLLPLYQDGLCSPERWILLKLLRFATMYFLLWPQILILTKTLYRWRRKLTSMK